MYWESHDIINFVRCDMVLSYIYVMSFSIINIEFNFHNYLTYTIGLQL